MRSGVIVGFTSSASHSARSPARSNARTRRLLTSYACHQSAAVSCVISLSLLTNLLNRLHAAVRLLLENPAVLFDSARGFLLTGLPLCRCSIKRIGLDAHLGFDRVLAVALQGERLGAALHCALHDLALPL